jgi:hypothetical protein
MVLAELSSRKVDATTEQPEGAVPIAIPPPGPKDVQFNTVRYDVEYSIAALEQA